MLEKVKSRKQLSLIDVPKLVAEDFLCDVKEEYGNVRWVKLKDLMRKAEAYDMFVQFGIVPQSPPPSSSMSEEEESKDDAIQTLTKEYSK